MEAESMSRRSLVASQTFGCCLGKEYIVELHEKSLSGSIRNEGREIRTPNLLIWSQTRCRCAIPPVMKNNSQVNKIVSTKLLDEHFRVWVMHILSIISQNIY